MITSRRKSIILHTLKNKDDFKHYVEADPTATGKYLYWIVSLKNINIYNDKFKIRQYLKKFDQYKRSAKFTRDKDIYKYRSFNKLADVVDEYEGVDLKSNRQLFKSIKLKGSSTFRHGNIKVVAITTPEAAVLFSKGTRWCISTHDVAIDYLADGPLYAIFKDDIKIALADFYFNDVKDENMIFSTEDVINIYEAIRLTKVLIKLPISRLPEKYEDIIAKLHPHDIVAYLISVDSTWPEVGKLISVDPYAAFQYAFYILGGKWEDGEYSIRQSPKYAYWYSTYFIDGRWEEAESTIINDGKYILPYAKDILCGRWAEAEDDLVKKCDAKVVEEYISLIEKEWPEAAANLKQKLQHASNQYDLE